MTDDDGRTCHSFPITVTYLPETGKIQLIRKTERPFVVEISADPQAADGHAALYSALLGVFLDRPGDKDRVN
ncbi:MAG: hypothetical protein AAGP08_00865 [Pseudomonadota bacterium]